MPGWEGIDNLVEPRVRNRGEVVLANLAAGVYSLTRKKDARVGDLGRSSLCNGRRSRSRRARRRPPVRRDRAPSIAGRIEGLDRDKYPGAFVVRPPGNATGNPFARDEMLLPIFDFTTARPDATFATERLLPGHYTVVVDVYAPPPQRNGRLGGGLDAPVLVGTAKVTVPAEGKPEAVVIAPAARWRRGRSRLRNWKPGQIRIQTRGRDRRVSQSRRRWIVMGLIGIGLLAAGAGVRPGRRRRRTPRRRGESRSSPSARVGRGGREPGPGRGR